MLFNNKNYAFLGENASARLENARRVAENAKMRDNMLVYLGGQSYCLSHGSELVHLERSADF